MTPKQLSIFLLASIASLFHSHLGIGQRYASQNYSLSNGLPQSEVWFNSMITDNDGQIWLGTNGGGLVRMSGQNFEVFTTKQGLPNNQIRGIQQDRNGDLWILTSTAGLVKYDGYSFKSHIDDRQLLVGGRGAGTGITKLDRHGNVWMVASGVLYRLENDTLRVQSGFEDTPLGSVVVNRVALDEEGNVVIAIPQQRKILSHDGTAFIPSPIDIPDWLKGWAIGGGREDARGNIWFFGNNGSPNAPNFLLKYTDGGFRKIEPLPAPYSVNAMVDVLEDQEGNYWFGFFAMGVVKKEKNSGEFKIFDEKSGLARNTVSALAEDYEGNIWVGTRGGGLCLLPKVSFDNFSSLDGLPGKMVFGIYEDSKGTIWVGTNNGGFGTIDSDGKVTAYDKPPYSNLIRIDAFFEEPEGSMLISARGSGIFRFDGKNLKRVESEFGLPRGAGAASLIEENGLLFISSAQAGVSVYDYVKKQVLQRYTTANGLPSNFTTDARRDLNGNVWVATAGGPAYCQGDSCITVPHPDGEPWNIILQLEVDLQGRVWFISYDQGLYSYENGKLRKFDMTQNNPLGLLYSLAFDNEGSLWLGTQTGVQKASIDENGNVGNTVNYGISDGLSEIEMNGHAVEVDSDGNIWFGHLSGLSRYKSGEVSFNETPPRTKILEVKLMGQSTKWDTPIEGVEVEGIRKWYGLPNGLKLRHTKNYLSFKFASLTYQSPDKVRRQWALEGVDKDWLEPSENSEATYSNIPYGTHTFKVRTMNSDGVWGVADTLTFTVVPPMWATPWFQGGIIGFIALLIFGGVRLRIQSIKAKKEELEELVHVRTLALQDKNKEVSLKNEELRLQQQEIIAKSEEIEQQHDALSTAYDEIRLQNHNITSSITYARRIQDAMLPRISDIENAFVDSFIFYKPRDIVSGDFYWFKTLDSQEDGSCIFAAADCTGHGVPGAFMSMAGDAYLNIAVKIRKLTSPAEILEDLDRSIMEGVQRDEGSTRDGMDISLCLWEPSRNILRYSGAKSPLVYIQDGKINYLKATKRSIGDLMGMHHSFEEHEIAIDRPTTLYLFSDGYVDQFGGSRNKKFLIKQFRELLLDIHYLPMKQQRDILSKQLNEWMGDYTQIDDILVMGFKLEPK